MDDAVPLKFSLATLLLLIFLQSPALCSGEPVALQIRGTLPWHNFLSGPTAWNEEDWEEYLDWMQDADLNLLALHCYTGGAERYMNYVEPMIQIEFRGVVPEAGFDTSLTARWGYRPLAVKDFAFDTGKLFDNPEVFGSRAATEARDNEDRYQRAQELIRRVIKVAHERGIKVAMGFEFGIYPPELFSIVANDSYLHERMLPDPTHPHSIQILRNTLDNILQAYPGLDGIWLWLQEHEPPSSNVQLSQPLQKALEEDGPLFDGGAPEKVFAGVWALTYIRYAHEYLKERAPHINLTISGWGGAHQLPSILNGLDKGLPPDITFTCLSPNMGREPQPEVLTEIASRRQVIIIPWLEGDDALWHPQPRVSLLREHLRLAQQQGVAGAVAIHWRTEDIRMNMKAFSEFALNPESAPDVEAFYQSYAREQYGEVPESIIELLVRMDRDGWFETMRSPEFFPFDPTWGRMKEDQRIAITSATLAIEAHADSDKTTTAAENLHYLASALRTTLQLEEISRFMEPAYQLQMKSLRGEDVRDELTSASISLESAPIEELFRTYTGRVRSRGELGVLSSMNQRLWLQYLDLKEFLSQDQFRGDDNIGNSDRDLRNSEQGNEGAIR